MLKLIQFIRILFVVLFISTFFMTEGLIETFKQIADVSPVAIWSFFIVYISYAVVFPLVHHVLQIIKFFKIGKFESIRRVTLHSSIIFLIMGFVGLTGLIPTIGTMEIDWEIASSLFQLLAMLFFGVYDIKLYTNRDKSLDKKEHSESPLDTEV